ncbi:MAG: SHOCT domain-containing protein [Frankiaceae bacterium]|jgi:putative membrane protein
MMDQHYSLGWGWLFGLLLLIGLGLLIVVVVRVLGGGISRGSSSRDTPPPASGPRPSTRSRAREILGERYASGELSTEEYRERLQNLGEDT